MSGRTVQRPIKIAIIAMGGQGGGVLSKWVVDLAENNGFIAQYTSVPGVAQRTGATIYYVGLFPLSGIDAGGKAPVMALMPAEGDVDIVIASEMMEVGRALMRGFVTSGTTLIGSSHREYAIIEKQELGDGRRDTAQVDALARETAARYICFDMDRIARESGAVISAVLFGALCASGALPFTRAQFENTIRKSGKAVDLNLRGLAAGIDAAGGPAAVPTMPEAAVAAPAGVDLALAELVDDLRAMLSGRALELALSGLDKVVDFQDVDYGRDYVARIRQMKALDAASGGAGRNWALTEAMVRYLALAMAYDDVIRVADIKTRSGRFESFRADIKAERDQVVHIREFMHPRWQEICEILPRGIGGYLLRSPTWNRMTAPLFGKGRRIRTTSLPGFLLLFTLGRLKGLRRGSLRFAAEQRRIADWFARVEAAAPANYDLAVEIAGLQRLIKGYGDTHARSIAHFEAIAGRLATIARQDDASARLRKCKQAALADDEGRALHAELALLDAAVAA